jgi:hypothetical protein
MVNIVADGRRARLREQWEGKEQHGQHDVLDRSTAWGQHRSSPGLQSQCMVSTLATTRTHFCSARGAARLAGFEIKPLSCSLSIPSQSIDFQTRHSSCSVSQSTASTLSSTFCSLSFTATSANHNLKDASHHSALSSVPCPVPQLPALPYPRCVAVQSRAYPKAAYLSPAPTRP